MSLLQKNKNLLTSACLNKKEQVQPKQTKKKTCIIKLEVNKLLKPQLVKPNFHKNTKSQYLHSHYTSQAMHQHHKSLEKQVDTKNEKKKTKTFEELYFQKIKQLKIQQNSFIPFSHSDEKTVLVQKIRPNSCKNIVSIKTKNRKIFPQPQSTKNYLTDNKENFLNNQKGNESNQDQKESMFFKKKSPKITESECALHHNITRSVQKVSQQTKNQKEGQSQEKKCKKILKIKRPSQLIKQQQNQRQEHKFFRRPSLEKPKSKDLPQNVKKQSKKVQKLAQPQQKTLFSPISSSVSHSSQLKTFKLSTPSSSGQKSPQISFTQSRFDEIIQRQINHSLHEHIWDGVECFFSFEEFQLILHELGFKNTFHSNQISLYVQKLWGHLGGDLYGGVVRKNMRQFLNIVLQDDNDINNQIPQVSSSKQQLSIEENLIDKASLRLIKLDQMKKNQIRRIYFPFRISKIASQIPHFHKKINSGQKLYNSIQSDESFSGKSNQKLSNQKPNSVRSIIPENKEICLQNNAYLETISVKSRNHDLSPCMIPRSYDLGNDLNMVTDFSPKMTAQNYEPFKSTMLNKDDFNNEKLSTEQQEEHETEKKDHHKPLLSVDVNLGEGILEKLLVYEDENPYEISVQLKERYNIDEELREKFEKMLRNHLNTMLFKIEEVSEEFFEDSIELKDEDKQKNFMLMAKE